MLAEMEKLKADKTESKAKASKYQTPPPRIPAPSPGSKASSSTDSKEGKAAKAVQKEAVEPPAERPPPVTEGAKLNRLRRLCEKKPSGRCNVPPMVHERWLKSNKQEKEAMIDELESVNWSKDRIKKTPAMQQ